MGELAFCNVEEWLVDKAEVVSSHSTTPGTPVERDYLPVL